MPARKSSLGLVIVDPPLEALGPHMLSLTELQRRFVVGIISNKFKDASRVARIAGYTKNDNVSRGIAYDLLRHPKIIKAIHEEAGRRLEGLSALAVLALEGNLTAKDRKARQNAADSILDRVGFPRRTERTLEVDDKRPANRPSDQLAILVAEKLRALYNIALPQLPAPTVIEGDFNVASDTGNSGIQDERSRGDVETDAPTEIAASHPSSGARKTRTR